ncbi:MAG: hypothetical protein AAGD14_12955 [Planctomycetota bacterium]
MRIAATLLFLLAPCFADDADLDALIDKLFSPDANVRAEARAIIAARKDVDVAKLLAKLEARRTDRPVLRVYDISDLATTPKERKYLVLQLRSAAGKAERFRLDPDRSVAVVVAMAAVHEQFSKELDELRRRRALVIQLETRVLQLPEGVKEVPGHLAPKELAAWMRERKAKPLQAPHVIARNGDKVSIDIVEKVSYIEDFDLEVEGDTALLDPVVGVLEVGTALQLRPVFADDGSIHVSTRLQHTKAKLPFPTLKVPTPMGTTFEVQVPSHDSLSIAGRMICRPGRVTLLRIDERTVLAIAASRVELPTGGSR